MRKKSPELETLALLDPDENLVIFDPEHHRYAKIITDKNDEMIAYDIENFSPENLKTEIHFSLHIDGEPEEKVAGNFPIDKTDKRIKWVQDDIERRVKNPEIVDNVLLSCEIIRE